MNATTAKREIDNVLHAIANHRQRLEVLLEEMHRENDPHLNGALCLAHGQGYTLEALGQVLGLTRERVRQRIAIGDQPPKRAFEVTAEDAALLQQLCAGADGRDPAKRKSTAMYRTFLIDLRAQGATLSCLGDLLGLTPGAIAAQIERHRRDNPAEDLL